MFQVKQFRRGQAMRTRASRPSITRARLIFRDLARMGRFPAGFLHIAGISAGSPPRRTDCSAKFSAHRNRASGGRPTPGFTIAYISDTHLYTRDVNDRFIRSAVKAVEEVNALNPQPDFVLFGGDLAQLGRPEELDLGAQILKDLKAPLKMMVGEHDWFLDMGEHWRSLFGPSQYSFDHKGVHFVTLMSVNEKDFWTARGMSPGGLRWPGSTAASSRGRGRPGRAPMKHRTISREWTSDAHRHLLLTALQILPQLEFLDRRRQRVQAILSNSIRCPSSTVTPISFSELHQQYQLLWSAVDRLARPYARDYRLTVQMNRADPFNA